MLHTVTLESIESKGLLLECTVAYIPGTEPAHARLMKPQHTFALLDGRRVSAVGVLLRAFDVEVVTKS